MSEVPAARDASRVAAAEAGPASVPTVVRASTPAAVRAPNPRRTRRGEVIIGPSIGARYLPGALIGLPLVSLVLCPLAAGALRDPLASWSWALAHPGRGADSLFTTDHLPAEHSLLAGALGSAPAPLVLGFLLTWAVLALWALLPIAITSRAALLDLDHGTLRFRRGLRRGPERRISEVLWAVGDPERSAVGLIGLPRRAGEGGQGGEGTAADPRPDPDADPEQWVIPAIGWDDASFDGLRILQDAAGFPAAPPRPVLAAHALRERRAHWNRQMAERIGIPWRPEYQADPALFQRDFDHGRRVLGGKEPAVPVTAPAPR